MHFFHSAGIETGWTPAVWAAIAQAVLSAAAILAAWWLQNRQHRLDLLQRSGAVVALLQHATDVGLAASNFAKASVDGTIFASLDHELLKALREEVDAVPVYDLPIADLAGPVLSARRAMRMLQKNVEDGIERAKHSVPMSSHLAHLIWENHQELLAALETAQEAQRSRARRWAVG